MSISGGLKHALLAVLVIAATIPAFPVLVAVGIVLQFAVVLAIPLLAAAVLTVPRIRLALFKAEEPRPAAIFEAQMESLPSLVPAVSRKDAQRPSFANGFAVAAVIVGAVVTFPLLAALGLVFQFLAILSLAVILLSPFLARAFRTTKSSR
jgi:hypothetical protein